jgi:nucleoside-diphosphate-sugar epimerase
VRRLTPFAGVDAVAHLASPVALTFDDPEGVIKTAIAGALRALEAANKAPSVKTFIFMSSLGAIMSTKPGDYTFTEADWNDESEALVAKSGKEAGFNVYLASKTAAERAVWEFRDQHKPKFTLAAINPTYVFLGSTFVVP